MNIAISTNSIWNFIKFRKGLAKSLQNKGHKIFLLSKNDKYKKEIQKNIKFIEIPINRSPISIINDFFEANLFSLYRKKNVDGTTIKYRKSNKFRGYE